MSRLGSNTALVVLFLCVPGTARGQLTESDRSRLADEIQAAAQNLDVNLFPEMETSKAAVLRRAEGVRQYFERSTTSENRDAWLAYLDIDPLVEAIESDQSPGAKVPGPQSRRIGSGNAAPP